MKVNLKCQYGNLSPLDNPHDLKDDLAKKLIDKKLAEVSTKSASSSATAEVKALEAEVEKYKAMVTEAINLPKGTAPEGWEEQKMAKKIDKTPKMIELKKDVKGLGKKGDKLKVSPRRLATLDSKEYSEVKEA